ncbi:MAG: glycosyltransferase [Anaerolineae bacterium]|nr:glycosyltransferase [Anaerolineae bacterium]
MGEYHLNKNYIPRLTPEYFHDVLDDSEHWQADVYRLAIGLARKTNVTRLIDLGCGRGKKLTPYANEFEITGIDYRQNVEYCRSKYNWGTWLSCDFENDVPEIATENAIVICADVIEHLIKPDALIKTLRNAAETAAYVLVSTPDRERLYRDPDRSPPDNKAHVREWTNAELEAWFVDEGLPVRWAGWTVSYEPQQNLNTSLIILSAADAPIDLPPNFQPASHWRKSARARTSTSKPMLKVWMTPTPSEAGRDLSNSINNIVCRLDKHLPDYGVELVENEQGADLRAGHAGQGSQEPIDVAHYHGLYPTSDGMESSGYFAINKNVIRNLKTAKAITAPSEWIADVLRRDMHVNPHVIGWGVDTQEWTPSPNPQGYVLWNKARVDHVSDPSPMIQLAGRMPKTLFLSTFGEGTPNIKTVGRQPYEVMKSYVRNAGVYLSLNVETFGIGTLEAMASGVPVLGFRLPNTDHLVEHGVHGFLAEPGDIDGLAEGLAYCQKHRKTLGENAREAVKVHSWDKVTEQFAAIYRAVLEPHKGAKISVVIPCHNYAAYVGEAIESVLNQQAAFKYEIIVVLDRCSDNSAEVVARYANRGVKAILADNGNLSATRNQGIEMATGEFICCLDADDRIGSPLYLQTLADALDKDRTLGIAFTSLQVMSADGVLGHSPSWPDGWDFDKQYARINQIPSLCMFRKEAWRRAGGFRPYYRYVEDAEFWTTMGEIGYGAQHVTHEPWFQYRLHDKSASQVHRTGEVPEPDWLEWHPGVKDGQRPFAAGGKAPKGSWPVRFYDKPEVSIIIPVGKGHEGTVTDALHSVEGQTFRMWEAIVVNDSGSDLHLENGFPWAREIKTKGCIGAGAARNLGAKQSHAPFIVFLDADDMLKPRFLEATLKAYRQHGRYAYTDWLTEEKQTNFVVHPTPEYSFQAVWERPSIHPVTTLLPRAWFDAVGGFDEEMTAFEDVDFFMKMLVHGFCGVRVPEPLLIYHLQSGFRRTAGEAIKDQFKVLLTKRYGGYMEGRTMCNCVEPPKGKPRVPPSPENIADYRESYGEMVKIQLTSEESPVGQVMFFGPATRVPYGRRARNDVFYVWEKDVTESEGIFTVVNDYETVPEPTLVPPAPNVITPPAVIEPEPEPIDSEEDTKEAPAAQDPVADVAKAEAPTEHGTEAEALDEPVVESNAKKIAEAAKPEKNAKTSKSGK